MRTKSIALNESELYERLALLTGYSQQVVRDVIKAQTEIVCDSLLAGTPVRIGLGEISVLTYQGRGGFSFQDHNINDGQTTHARVRFHPSAVLRRTVADIKNNLKQ